MAVLVVPYHSRSRVVRFQSRSTHRAIDLPGGGTVIRRNGLWNSCRESGDHGVRPPCICLLVLIALLLLW